MSTVTALRRMLPGHGRRRVVHVDRFGGTLGLVACVLVALCGTDVLQLWRMYEANIEQTERVTTNTARLVVAQADTTIQTADTIVASLVERVEADGLGPESRTRLYGLMTSLAAALPAIHEMGVTDSQGNAIVKSLKPDPSGLNYSERQYFEYHKTHADRGPFIGARIKSKIDGSYNVTVTRRVNRPDGSFGGLVVASVSMGFFQTLFDQMQSRTGGVIALISDTGVILARSPSVDNPDAEINPGAILSREELAHRGGGTSVDYVSGSDGVRRLGSYQHLNRYPMTAVVAQSYWDVQTGWRDQLTWHGLMLACVTTVLLILGGREVKSTRMLNAHAMQDALTGLPNRRAFDERLGSEYRRAARSGQPLSLILIDIDHFKHYNDCYGHVGGDDCLRQVATAIMGSLHRAGDFAARYGGEEFVVMLPGADASQAFAFAEAMRLAVVGIGLPHAPDIGGVVTFSAGVTTCMPASASGNRETLVEAADEALYAAKASGRNTVVPWRRSMTVSPMSASLLSGITAA